MDHLLQKKQNWGQKKQRSVQMGSAVELLRPFVENKMWDYCVIWKLGDDPSKFIEWGGCCCSGAKKVGTLEILGEESLVCKDNFTKHKVRSKACRALARLPSYIPLYSGIHGDVVISKQPRWVVHGGASASDSESDGTQVLIPVASGLVELFSTKQVPKDQKTIDYISSGFKISVKQENMPENSYNNFNLREQIPDPYFTDFLKTSPPSLHPMNLPPPISQTNNYSSFDGSSTCSSLSNEHLTLKIGSVSPEKESRKLVASPRNSLKLKRKRDKDFEMGCGSKKVTQKMKQKPDKGPYKSKNLMTERNRRKRIKDGMFTLRALVPKISKMDRVSTLGDAAEYIEELHETIENYHDELRKMDEEDHSENIAKTDVPKLERNCLEKKDQPSASEITPTEVQVEVSKIGTKDFLLKLVCNKRQGGFSRLMDAINLLGLEVKDANVTALHGSVLNILRVEANRAELEPKTLKHSLLKLVD